MRVLCSRVLILGDVPKRNRALPESGRPHNIRIFHRRFSARNCIEGKVVAIHDGPVSTEVTVETPAGERIVSSITTTSAKALGLKGAKAYAVIKASNVMLAVD